VLRAEYHYRLHEEPGVEQQCGRRREDTGYPRAYAFQRGSAGLRRDTDMALIGLRVGQRVLLATSNGGALCLFGAVSSGSAPPRLTTIHRAELVQSLLDCEQEVCRVHERTAEG
jgi:hypothetical protein